MRPARLGELVLGVLFPRRCRWCGRVVGFAPACRCGTRPEGLRLPVGPLAADELEAPSLALGAWACWRYEGPVRDSLHRYKFRQDIPLQREFGADLAARFEAAGLAGRFDVVVPVPVSADTLRKRGYNQSALLARALARQAGLPCAEKALKKSRPTTPQMRLDRQGRLENLKGAFAADAPRVKGKKVLLVDDIVTTGSTLEECAKTLLAAGAAGCGALCVAATEKPR